MAIRSLKELEQRSETVFSLKERNTLSDSSCAGAGWLSGSILGGYELSEKTPLL